MTFYFCFVSSRAALDDSEKDFRFVLSETKIRDFITIPCEPNTSNRHIESHVFCEIRSCFNNIVYARFEVFRTLLCVFISGFRSHGVFDVFC